MDTNSQSTAFDPQMLADRLQWERRGYWLHLDAASPLEKYPAKQHARRVQEKLGAEAGLIYLPGASNRNIEDSDMPIRFRQRRYFYYVTGCNEPDCQLVYNIRDDQLTLFLPRIDPRRVLYYGRGSTKAEALSKYDIDQVRYVDELQHFIVDWAKYHKGSVYVLHPNQAPRLSGFDGIFDSTSLQPAMNLARVIKDHHEIKLIRKANNISSIAHREVLANISKFKNEAQVEGLFLDVCISKQAKEQAYDPIAASGPNAGTLHYAANNEDFEDRQLMCLDAGCEYELYASDITRTFPLSATWPSTEAEQIYRLVQRMQDTCIERLAPGVRYLDVHILAHQIAIDGLLTLGILHNGSREEIFKAGTSRAFFPHGLGHHVGLEVHDVGQADLMSVRKGNPAYEKAPSLYPENFHLPVFDAESCMAPTDPQSGHLEEGMVVTVEPGIYFSTYLLKYFYFPSPIHSKYINKEMVHKYLPVGGVRIEDDILITSKGYENLTTAPKGDEMLEIIRSQNSQASLPSELFGPEEREPKISRKQPEVEQLVRAPGISDNNCASIHAPLSRGRTLPAEVSDRRTYDFEPFDGPSLYTNFKRAATIDNAAVHKVSKISASSKPQSKTLGVPVCGENSREYEHTFMNIPGDRVPSSRRSTDVRKPPCKSCFVLVQTLGRLRKNLSVSEQSSPVPQTKSAFEKFGNNRMGIEPLHSASRGGVIDASIRPHEPKMSGPKEPIPRHFTASPVSMDPKYSAPQKLEQRSNRRTSDNIADWLASTSNKQQLSANSSLQSIDTKQRVNFNPESDINKTSILPEFTGRIPNSGHSLPPTKPPRKESIRFPPPTTSCFVDTFRPLHPRNHVSNQAVPMNNRSSSLSLKQSLENNSLKQPPFVSQDHPRIFELPLRQNSNGPPFCHSRLTNESTPAHVGHINPFTSSIEAPLIDLATEKPVDEQQKINAHATHTSKSSPWSVLSSVTQCPPPQVYPSKTAPTSPSDSSNEPQKFGHGQPQDFHMTCGVSIPPPPNESASMPLKSSRESSGESRSHSPSHPLRDFEIQLAILEEQNRKRLAGRSNAQPQEKTGRSSSQGPNHSLAHYQAHLEALEQVNRIRRNKAGAEYKATNGLE